LQEQQAQNILVQLPISTKGEVTAYHSGIDSAASLVVQWMHLNLLLVPLFLITACANIEILA